MALEFKLPDIGEGVVEGEIVRWLVKEGDVLREDQPMVEVMTDKATVEIPTPRAGRVHKLMVDAGKLCAVGQVMIVIDTGGTASPSAAPTPAAQAPVTQAAPAQAAQAQVSAPVQTVSAAEAAGRKVLATPATRQLARNLGIDIRTVLGSGPGGRITRDDVRRLSEKATAPAQAAPIPVQAPAAAQKPAAPAPRPAAEPVTVAVSADDERIAFRGVRKKIAENMLRSKQSAAHFTYVEEVDVTDLVALRKRAQKRAQERGAKLSFLPFIIKAVVSGLKKYPILNATLDQQREEIVLRKQYNIGVAAATDSGLIVPVLRNADKMSLFQIASELEPLAERARTGKASRDELTGSTFTISSLGKLGGVLATPIINFPEVAILGVHKIKETPAVRDGQIVVRQVMNLSISLDHRIVDGYEGAMFLQHVVSLLEDPTLMFMELT
ncbi:MAG TPA: dihydrolipoamide acetyltransferase family protein [Pseudomonadota bacterium]|nr:dihydrolipoamide acetyltransferase family protein [Pseudomonadota bacterium]HNI58576.1 dihydrolipoamide acetyltransferase family protein [Pseudomonadota bacterium]HNO68729.1 dihydrolipoamide acetyltransferase family protein [Pseudomonadota bacterium]